MLKRFFSRKLIQTTLAAILLLASSGLTPAAAQGPLEPESTWVDGYGYQLSDAETTAWVDANVANGGTAIVFTSLRDGYSTNAIIPGFTFKLYEGNFTRFWVSTSGIITFAAPEFTPNNKPIPFPPTPNSMIAPLWGGLDLTFGQGFYRLIGSAPNRKMVIEWEIFDKALDEPDEVMVINFEAILEEGTNTIWFLYKTLNTDYLPESYSVGIEDNVGINGLQYAPALTVAKNLRFTRPGTSKRVKVWPRYNGGFAAGGKARFTFNIFNNGNLAGSYITDTYKVQWSSSVSGWTGGFLSAGGVPLTDSNGDGFVDTGPIGQGYSTNLTFVVAAPANAIAGDETTFTITVTSTDATKFNTITLVVAVPTEFAQVYQNSSNRGVLINQIWKENVIGRQILSSYEGATFSMRAMSPNQYMGAWEDLTTTLADGTVLKGGQRLKDGRLSLNGEIVEAQTANSTTDILYRLVNRFTGAGATRSLTHMADKLAADHTLNVADARSLAIAGSETGGTAVAWRETLKRDLDPITSEINANLFMAVIDAAGGVTASKNLTNDNNFFSSAHLYLYQNVALVGDTTGSSVQYAVCWVAQYTHEVRCGFYTQSGATLNAIPGSPLQVASYLGETTPFDLTMTPLPSSTPKDRVLAAYFERLGDSTTLVFSVWNSSGPVKGRTEVAGANGYQPRAIQFANGYSLLIWLQVDGRLGHVLLSPSYETIGVPVYEPLVDRRIGIDPSITLDRNQHAVVTWLDGYDFDAMYYAMFDNGGAVMTPPMAFLSDFSGNTNFLTNTFGFGNAGYSGVYPLLLPFLARP